MQYAELTMQNSWALLPVPFNNRPFSSSSPWPQIMQLNIDSLTDDIAIEKIGIIETNWLLKLNFTSLFSVQPHSWCSKRVLKTKWTSGLWRIAHIATKTIRIGTRSVVFGLIWTILRLSSTERLRQHIVRFTSSAAHNNLNHYILNYVSVKYHSEFETTIDKIILIMAW